VAEQATFTNKQTAEKFEFTSQEQNPNQQVHVPAVPAKDGNKKLPGFSGRIADIPLAAAERLAAQGSNILREKTPATKPTASSEVVKPK